MIVIKTYLAKSNISGIGIFASNDVPKGTVIWKYSEFFDLKMSPEKFELLTPEEKKRFKELDYYYFDKAGNYVLPQDHDKFMNHSFDPNIVNLNDDVSVASRDIKANEELTIDYRTIVPQDQWDPYFSK